MPFDVIPAIDVAGGRLVRLRHGEIEPVKDFDGDPLAAGRAFVAAGVRWLHVVDVDLALTGEPGNLPLLSGLAQLGARVQGSGGLRTASDVRAVLDAGATRAVVGSAGLADPELVAGLIAEHGERLVVGIEVDGDRIRSRDASQVDLALDDTLSWLGTTAVARYLVTAVDRVAGLVGPDLGTATRAVATLGRPWIAAGGIASLDDLSSLATAGAEGAVVGRAALEGGLDLRVALALAGDRP